MKDAEPVVAIADLRVEVAGRAIVDGVSLTARAGRITAVVGASGSGKTTTGLALLGEFPPGARVTGSVRVTGAGPVAYIPQHPGAVLGPARRVGALLRDIARPAGGGRAAIRERVYDALRAAAIPDPEEVVRRFPHQLSGGQQQRVVLAQALLLGARAVVADEPTTGQDALTKQGVVERLAAVAGHGIAVLLLSHDVDVVRRLADDVVVLSHGRVVECGPAVRALTASEQPAGRTVAARRAALPAPRSRAVAESRLEVRDLVARHRGRGRSVDVLHGVSLAVGAGECLALVGRSGSGKTTVGRCLAGLHSDHDGRILLDGVPLRRSLRARTRAELVGVQHVFQDARAAFDEYRPVVEQVARTAVRLRGVEPGAARAQALRTLAELGLPAETSGRRPGALSGGEVQRAALARALLARPRVLVCDEITSGLDASTRQGILDVLAELRERVELSLVFITHDLAAAGRLADRIAVLDGGRVVEQGPARRILTEPGHPFTRMLVGAAGAGAGDGGEGIRLPGIRSPAVEPSAVGPTHIDPPKIEHPAVDRPNSEAAFPEPPRADAPDADPSGSLRIGRE
ncbi:ABC transporter ATP-binding protein [Embleya scabrispora]|uniref:ABC transporter ATP-binding protein n=1 Tax=Embleya scabrispora TaxID=159449 RepID=UPI00037F9E80|nr:ATP-binding cassette domain-containing protein [Embleya scabrispora]MYS81545.1 ATP-binding cassette domain-containing protein [Streptomyces sp. SID5474]